MLTQDETIHGAFAKQARNRPAERALIQGQTVLTYAELSRAADDYAAELAALGVRPGDLVPVLLPRSPELVATLLALLKLGAAYSVLDPRWPEERRTELVHQLGSSVVVTHAQPVSVAIQSGRIVEGAVTGGEAPSTVFFTSGTTGNPKGVVSPHRATTRLFTAGSFADFGPGCVTSVAAAMAWDAFSLELWGPLVSGGTAVLTDGEYFLPETLSRMIRDRGVNTTWLTVSLFNLFVDEQLDCFRGLSRLIIGGERLSPAHVCRFLTTHPAITLLNGYGPVESCVFATTHTVMLADTRSSDGVPLGRPVPRTQVLVLRDEVPAAPDEPGEIWIGGAGLAIEYLANSEETEKRFTTVQTADGEARLYRTGDRGFLDDDGILHYLGRADRQVKIRGHRVEPAEVESVCEAMPEVERAVVIPVEGADLSVTCLALFYTASAEGRRAGSPTLTDRLREALPAYCVPELIEELNAFPLTAQGKTDHRALLARLGPDKARTGTGIEVLFHEILQPGDGQLDHRSPDTAWAELGGTSLDAMRLCARIQAQLGVRVSVSDFMRDPSLNGLRRVVGHAMALPVRGASTTSIGQEIPLIGMPAHFCMAYEMSPADTSALCRRAWAIDGPVDLVALERAAGDLHERHEALRASYRLGDGPVAYLDPGRSSFALTDLGQRSDGEPAESALREALLRPLSIHSGEVWRCAVVRTESGSTLLGLTVHHVAFDGWSESLLVSELTTAYRSRIAGIRETFDGPAPTLAELALEEATVQRRSDRERHLDHWKTSLLGAPELNLARPRSTDDNPVGVFGFTLDTREVERLTRDARQCGGTLFLALLTGYDAALRQVLGQDDFCIGVPVARRGGAHAIRAVACLVDMLCMRLPSADEPGSLGDRMRRTCSVIESAMACQDVAFDEVVAALAPLRTGRNPLYQTVFAYQSNPARELALDGCTVRALPQPPAAPRAELACEAWPQPDGGLRVEVTFQARLVRRDIARRIADVYQVLLTKEDHR
ncbi:mycobactin peptide synthetase MbtE [Streptomyces umbrinus]|uniref:Mycobactin peptide synthetase MbtE n=1 Tax=Streptomyces umbrinus TaxID=67370 RepID=A0ABU0SMN6_9ACTN|nr:AMP-binding protein [Streptomyces umbrinus]MDQ1024732.1 mycobactin peptide synthetase MbtE [Streptomyces umbrinus]